jgi:WD40 repeat protein
MECVNSVSCHGNRIVSGSDDNTVRVWDAVSGQCVLGPLQGHTNWVQSVSFSPDGARIVSGSGDKTVRVWDVSSDKAGFVSGQCVLTLEGHTESVLSVSCHGARIVSGSYDHTVRVWDVSSDKAGFVSGQCVLGPLEGHTSSVWSVSFSPDGARIVSGSDDRTVRVWDVSIISEWDQLKREIVALYLSGKDKGLASNTEKNKGLALNRIMGWRWYTPRLKSVKKRADDVGFVIDDAELARLNALLVDMAKYGGGGGKKQRRLAIHLRL